MKITRYTLAAIAVPVLIVTLTANLVSCGTIMYPDRNGQKAGQIDPLVAVLDGIGLFFFIIPGVIAFAVDFSNHSIYLPHGHTSSNGAAHPYTSIRFSGALDRAGIENLVRAQTGVAVDLGQPDVRISRLDSVADLDRRFAMSEGNIRVAMAR